MNASGISTTQKGDDFEALSYELLYQALHNYKLGLIPGDCQVFKKKGYYFEKRKNYIVFDLAIEVWLQGAANYSLLNIIECKNYAKKVPVDDVEEFYAKIKQVGDVNLKGIFITNNGFQRGAYAFAKSVGMMLITVNDLTSLNIILHKANRTKEVAEEASEYTYSMDCALDENPVIQQLLRRKVQRLLDKEILGIFIYQVGRQAFVQPPTNVPFLSTDDIDDFTSELLRLYNPDILIGKRALGWDHFSQFLLDVYGLSIQIQSLNQTDIKGRAILSSCSFINKTITVDASLSRSERRGFILAHELGHFFLHNRIVLNQRVYEAFADSSYSLSKNHYELGNPRTWVEWQANQFAACLLMPNKAVLARLGVEQERERLRIGRPLYVDDQPCNQATFHHVTGQIARFFSTTKTSVIYRLNALGLLTINTRSRSVGQLIRETYPDYIVD